MNRRKEDVLAWESRWAVPVGVVTVLAVVLIVVSGPIGSLGGNGEAEVLRRTHESTGRIVASSLLQGFGILLLVAPLYYLFRLVSARSSGVRTQLVGVVLVAPLFLALSSGLTIGARQEAATTYVSGAAKPTISAAKAKEECEEQRSEKGREQFASEFEPKGHESTLAACERRKTEDNEASNAVGEASLAPVVTGFGIAGGLGLLAALGYSCLWGLRTGVLTRFWATLGMASGVAFLLGPLFIVTMVWFVYFALLLIGKLPGGRPPAWAAGEAVPWPTPGERVAKELEPRKGGPSPDGEDGLDSDADASGPRGPDGNGSPAIGPSSAPPRRKRKRRS